MNIVARVFLALGMGLFLTLLFKDAGLSILNPTALVIVLGGSGCALCIGFPFSKIRGTVKDVLGSFGDQRERETLVSDITNAARVLRRGDIRAMEHEIRAIKDDFLRFGLSLLLNRHTPEDIQQSMERELAARITHFHVSQNVLRTIARLTPAFGLVGTVIMLIRMFTEAHSFEALAPLMASALMSTLYGVIIANLFMLPLAARVKDRALSSEMLLNMTVEGVLAIHNEEHPLKIEEKLNCYETSGDERWHGNSPTLMIRSS